MTETIITKSVATKVTVTISVHKLWANFMASWSDISWDNYIGTDSVNQVAEALMRETLSVDEIRKLFRDCHTMLLLDSDSFSLIDRPDTLAEIVVVKGPQSVTVSHHDINY